MDKAKLNELKEKAKKLEDLTREGMNVTFISLASPNCEALKKGKESFIEGLSTGEYYIHKEKKRLGGDLRVVALGFLRAFNHFQSMDNNSNYLGVVSREEGMKYPLAQVFFNGKPNFSIRELPDGTVLRPVIWVPVFLPDFPEIENAVLTFKSTSVPVATAWKKKIEATKDPSPSFVCTLSFEWKEDGKNSWIIPSVSEMTPIEESGVTEEDIEKCFDLSTKILTDYTSGQFFPSKLVVAQLDDSSQKNLIEDNSEGEEIPF